MRIAVLVSGLGSNLESIHKQGIPVALIVADRPCTALNRARGYRIRREVVERQDFTPVFDAYREEYTRKLLRVLAIYDIDLVVMAGFKTVISPVFFERYHDRVLNLHPSRLPQFKGPHAVRDTLAHKPRPTITGSTVHVATSAIDEGRVLARSTVPVLPNDTEETLTRRLKKAECRLYPAAIRGYMMEIEYLLPAVAAAQ